MFDEQSFEWVFVVPEIDDPGDPRIDRLYDSAEAVVESHGGLTLVSVLVTGSTAVAAARAAIGTLTACDLRPLRTYPDLVTRGEIADRLGKRRQTVDNWVRGDRQKNFPRPTYLAGGGLWLWGEVQEWLQRERIKDIPEGDGVSFPSMADHALVDAELTHEEGWSGHSRLLYVSTESVRDLVAAIGSIDLQGTGPVFGRPRTIVGVS
ncbi:helix-turn-helix transcriptional regulator [Mycolicibacterium baixiangningiae]|uniref:helix-turn-helix transcriptional regulator n=1 Tax=Mycolicibacterium baixiangningiae TaxID=2761578 RepID=UPI001867DA8B|nr:hypothetical protein [Mycolicibacterium baixiangningiae]